MIQNILKKLVSTLLIGIMFVFPTTCQAYVKDDSCVEKNDTAYRNALKEKNKKLEQKLIRIKKRQEKMMVPLNKFYERFGKCFKLVSQYCDCAMMYCFCIHILLPKN